MAETKIQWTDATWNPVRGCSRVSEGCRECYAEREAWRITLFDRGRGVPQGEGAYDGLVKMTSQGPKWTGQIREVQHKLDEPLRWKKPRMVFVNSMSDLFHERVSEEYIADVFAYMAYARQHTFQVLTKRPDRMLKLLTSEAFAEKYEMATGIAHADACEILGRRGEFSPHARLTTDIRAMDPSLPRPNIWLGVSIEDQTTADERIPLLLRTPAAVRFVSAEPLLAPVCLTELQAPGELRVWVDALRGQASSLGGTGPMQKVPSLDWVITGGESGPKARPAHPAWFRQLREECTAAGVPFFFKQWGEWLPCETDCGGDGDAYGVADDGSDRELSGQSVTIATLAGHQQMALLGKKFAGRLLDGREWNEYPVAQEQAHG